LYKNAYRWGWSQNRWAWGIKICPIEYSLSLYPDEPLSYYVSSQQLIQLAWRWAWPVFHSSSLQFLISCTVQGSCLLRTQGLGWSESAKCYGMVGFNDLIKSDYVGMLEWMQDRYLSFDIANIVVIKWLFLIYFDCNFSIVDLVNAAFYHSVGSFPQIPMEMDAFE
jgi:hypothetical protein